jgi:hypothetical protein
MDQQWHYLSRGKQGGPVSPGQLKRMADSGQFRPADMVWTDGMSEWVPASALNGLFPYRPVPPPPAPAPAPAPAPSYRRAAREAYGGFQEERIAQWWAFWVAVIAAAAAAYFSWQWFGNPIVTIAASIVAFCVGGVIGYKCAALLSILLVIALLVGGVLLYIGHETLEDAKKKAVFDPKSLSATLLWMESQGEKVMEVDAKKNEILSKEARQELSRTLARAEGNQVQWQAKVASVAPAAVTLQGPSMGPGCALTFKVIAAGQLPAGPAQPGGPVLPVTTEQSRRLVAGQTITFTGRVLTCRAERSGTNLAFTLVVSEARVVD